MVEKAKTIKYEKKINQKEAKDADLFKVIYNIFKRHLGDLLADTEIKFENGQIKVEQEIENDKNLRPVYELTGPEMTKYKEMAMEQFFDLINVKLPKVREDMAKLSLEDNIDIDPLFNIREARVAKNVLVNLETGKLVLVGMFGSEKEDDSSYFWRPVKKVLRSLRDMATRGGGWEIISKGRTVLGIEIPSGEKDILALTYDDFPSETTAQLLKVLDRAEEKYRNKLAEQMAELQRLAGEAEDEFRHRGILKEIEFLDKKSEQGIKVTFFMNKGNMEIIGDDKTYQLVVEVLKRGHYIGNHETSQFPGDTAGYYRGHGGLAEMKNIMDDLKKKYPRYADQILSKLVRRSGVHFTKYFEDEKEKLDMVELLANSISLLGMHASATKPELLTRVAQMCTDQGSVLIWHIGKGEDTIVTKEGDYKTKMLKKEDMPEGLPYYPEVHVEATERFLEWYIDQNGKFAPTTKEYIPKLATN